MLGVGGMLGVRLNSMVFLDQRIKDISKVLVRIPVSSIDTTVMVVKLNGTGNSLCQSEARGLGLDGLQFVPFSLGNMLSSKRVLRLNIGEVSRTRRSRYRSHVVLLLELLILFPESVDSINHLLDKLNLRVSKSVLVGDVIGVSSLSTRFSSGSTGLQMKLLTSGLQLFNSMFGPSGKVNMNRGSHASTKIGRTRMDISVLLIKTEALARLLLYRISYSLDSLSQSFKDTLDITTILHRNDSELVFFIDPDKEGLLVIVENATTLRPVSFHASNLQISVTRDKEEMIINKLLSNLFIHTSQRIIVSSKIGWEVLNSALHELFNSNTLFLGDSRRKTKAINGSSNPNSGRMNRDIRVNIALDFSGVHVRGMLGVRLNSMVFLDQRIKDISKVLVRIPVSSIDTTVLVVKLNGTGNSLCQSEARGLGLDVLQFVPFSLGNMLSNKRVLRLNIGEFSRSRGSRYRSHVVLFLELLILFPESIDSINHLLDKLNLRVSKSVLVGDVIGVSSLSTRFSSGSTGLQMKLFTSCLQLVNSMFGPSRKVNMNRGSHASTKIGRTRMDISVLLIKTEALARLLHDRISNSTNTLSQSFKDTLDITTILHRNDSELVFLIDL